jgi:hypothetical protein
LNGDEGRRSSKKGFDVLKDLLIPSTTASRDEMHGSSSSARDGKDPDRPDILEDDMNDGGNQVLAVRNDGASRRSSLEYEGRESLQRDVGRDIKGRNGLASSMGRGKAPPASGAGQGHGPSKKGFHGLSEFIPSSRASPSNRGNFPRRSRSKEEAEFRRGSVKDEENRIDARKGSGFTASIGQEGQGQGSRSRLGIARGSLSSDKSVDFLDELTDDDARKDPGGNRGPSDSSFVTASEDEEEEEDDGDSDDDGGADRKPFERSFSFLPTSSSSSSSELEKPSLRGQEVLWALQQAAMEKAKLKQRKQKRPGKTQDGAPMPDEAASSSMRIKDAKPIIIKQEWKVQIEDLERRISDLQKFRASA